MVSNSLIGGLLGLMIYDFSLISFERAVNEDVILTSLWPVDLIGTLLLPFDSIVFEIGAIRTAVSSIMKLFEKANAVHQLLNTVFRCFLRYSRSFPERETTSLQELVQPVIAGSKMSISSGLFKHLTNHLLNNFSWCGIAFLSLHAYPILQSLVQVFWLYLSTSTR